MPNQKADPLGQVAAEVLADNPQLRNRVTRLVERLLIHAEKTMRFGSEAEKNALMKQVVPGLLRSLKSADVNADEATQAEAYDRIRAYARGDSDDL